jgi:hypothetical protein
MNNMIAANQKSQTTETKWDQKNEKQLENPHAESDKMKWWLDAAQKGDKESEKKIDDDIIGRWYPKPAPFA